MSRISLEAFAEAREHGDLERYLRAMAAEVARYRKLERGQILKIEAARVWNNIRFGLRRAGRPTDRAQR